MVHQVIQRPRLYHYLLTKDASFPVPKYGHPIEYAFELLYLIASAGFIAGCIFFLPPYDKTAYGCWCFDIGSLIFFFLSLYDVIEGAVLRRWATRHPQDFEKVKLVEIIEKSLYLVGSLVFAIGSWLYDPTFQPWIENFIRFENDEGLEFGATVMFAAGSLIFAFAAFVNATSLHHCHPQFVKWAIASVTCFEVGGLLFCTGSIGFLPNMGCNKNMPVLGTWLYLVGSVAYVLGCLISLMMRRALDHLQKSQVQHVLTDAENIMHSVVSKAMEEVANKHKEHNTAELSASDVIEKVCAEIKVAKRWKQHSLREIIARREFLHEEGCSAMATEQTFHLARAKSCKLHDKDHGLADVLFQSFGRQSKASNSAAQHHPGLEPLMGA